MRSLFIITIGLMLSYSASSQNLSNTTVEAKTLFLTTSNTVNFRGSVTDSSVMKAKLDLQRLSKLRGFKNYPIYVVFDSPGGSIDAGNDFIEFAKMYKNVHTIGLYAASMASAIMMQLPGDRFTTSNGILMFHRAAIRGLGGQIETGEAEIRLAFIKRLVVKLEQGNASRIGISIEQYKLNVLNEWYIYGVDNLKEKTVDGIVNIRCSDALIEARESVIEPGMFGSSKLDFSKCPLLRSPIFN